MATVYKIEVETVSPFVNYPEDYMIEMFTKFLAEYKDKETQLGFESTNIKVERK